MVSQVKMQALLNKKANPGVKDNYSRTPLDIAEQNIDGVHQDIVDKKGEVAKLIRGTKYRR